MSWNPKPSNCDPTQTSNFILLRKKEKKINYLDKSPPRPSPVANSIYRLVVSLWNSYIFVILVSYRVNFFEDFIKIFYTSRVLRWRNKSILIKYVELWIVGLEKTLVFDRERFHKLGEKSNWEKGEGKIKEREIINNILYI